MTAVVTYADVAETLPARIVEAVEVTGPCPVAPDHRHFWEFSPGTEDYDPAWACIHCGADTWHNPLLEVSS